MTTFWRWQLIAWHYGRPTGGAGPHQTRRSGNHCRTHYFLTQAGVFCLIPPICGNRKPIQSQTKMYLIGPVRLLLSKALFLGFVSKSIHCYYTELQLPKTFLLHLKLREVNITLASSAWS